MRHKDPRINLLIVEDEPLTLLGLQRGINWKSIGIDSIFTAPDGEKAYKICEKNPVHIVLTDIRMPGLDGLELGRRLRGLKHDIKIFYLTAFADFQYAQSALRLGAEDFFLKPVNIDSLTMRVRQAVVEYLAFLNGSQNDPVDLPEEKDYLREHDKMFYGYPEVKTTESKFSRPVLAVISRVQKEYSKPISLYDIAVSAMLSENYVSQKFKQETGVSFSHYVNLVRVHYAKYFLEHTSFRFYEIAELTGYRDYRYFSKVFKKITGLTLSEYRKTLRNDY
ncbi:MAG: response regulator [Treponema sp.]|jgi:two-component system response regulator YesN|nr:response regulator [Treponema sp.]